MKSYMESAWELEIKDRLAAITEGPWKTSISLGPERGDYRAYVYHEYLGIQDVIAGCLGDDTTDAKADAEFIAAAPADITMLLKLVADLRAELEEATS
jgi:hypothetical protein